MMYLNTAITSEGAYGPPQSNPFPGAIPLTDEQVQTVVDYNGFVTITSHEEEYEEGFFRTVYEVTPDTEAWEEWKESLPPEPEPEPTAEDITLDMLADHEERLCMLELTTTTV